MEVINISIDEGIKKLTLNQSSDSTVFKTWAFNTLTLSLFQEDTNYQDLSFGVFLDNDHWLFVPITFYNNELSFMGMPVKTYGQGLAPEAISDIWQRQIEQWKKIYPIESLLTEATVILKDFNSVEEVTISKCYVDLEKSEDEIFASLSKGNRSSVKSGQKNMTIDFITLENFKDNEFEDYKNFYLKVSKASKSQKFWDIKKELVKSGDAFFCLGKVGQEICSGSFYINGLDDVYYSFGVYDRDRMSEGFSLSHWPLFQSIIFSKNKNFKRFDLGHILSTDLDLKSKSIYDFKKRFSSSTEVVSYIRYNFLIK